MTTDHAHTDSNGAVWSYRGTDRYVHAADCTGDCDYLCAAGEVHIHTEDGSILRVATGSYGSNGALD